MTGLQWILNPRGGARGLRAIANADGTFTIPGNGPHYLRYRLNADIFTAWAMVNLPATIAGTVGDTLDVETSILAHTPAYAGAPVDPPPGGSSPITAIAADGFSATAADAAAAVGQTIDVQRAGFDALGNAVSRTEVVKIGARKRQPYPATPAPYGPAVPTDDEVTLEDYIYTTDTIAGVTNNSAWPAPVPSIRFVTPDRQIARGASFEVLVFAAHAYARNGHPLAALKLVATGGASGATAQVTLAATTNVAFESGLHAPCYRWAMPLDAFADGETVTINPVGYPWVGAAYDVAAQGDAYSGGQTPLQVKIDKGAYIPVYGFVDPAAGGGGAVSTDEATAAATPFATTTAAEAAIRAWYNTNKGRNFSDGGVIRLIAATHTWGPIPTTAVQGFCLTVRGAGATTILQDANATNNNQNTIPRFVVLEDMTMKKVTTGNYYIYNSTGAAENVLVLNRIAFDMSAAAANGLYFLSGRQWYRGCTVTAGTVIGLMNGYNATTGKWVTAIGNTGRFATDRSTLVLANVGMQYASRHSYANATMTAIGGIIIGFNFLQNPSAGGGNIVAAAAQPGNSVPIGPRGFFVVGNILECSNGTTAPGYWIGGDGNVDPMQNVVSQMNTVVGSRTNWLYNDSGSLAVEKRGYRNGDVLFETNTKTDLFTQGGAADGGRVGNWSQIYGVGSKNMALQRGDSNGQSAPGTGQWIGEHWGPNTFAGSDASPLALAFVNDASSTGAGGSGAGNGDYTPGAGSVIPLFPAGQNPYAIDQRGRALLGDGTDQIGALQAA